MEKALQLLELNLDTARNQVRVADTREDKIHAQGIVKGYEYAIKDINNAIGLAKYHAKLADK